MDAKPPVSLSDWFNYLCDLYGPRNTLFLRDVLSRVALLSVGLKDLQDGIRKGIDGRMLGRILARVFPRIVCVHHAYQAVGLPTVAIFTAKYQAGRCSYCRQAPCVCRSDQRPDSALTADQPFADYSLGQAQQELNRVYGAANRERGIDPAITHLMSEAIEVLAAVMSPPTQQATNQERLDAIAGELADTLAWLLAVANLLGIDIEPVVAELYWPHCRFCQQNPCSCAEFRFRPINWKEE